MILHVAAALGGCVETCVAVGHAPDEYDDLGLRTIPDLVAGRGPLSGLHAAICDADGESGLLLVGCDMAGLRPQWVGTLMEAFRPGMTAAAFRHDFWEPMPAIYSTSIRDVVEANLAARRYSLQDLLDGIGGAQVRLPPDWRTSPSINTPEELSRYISGPSAGGA